MPYCVKCNSTMPPATGLLCDRCALPPEQKPAQESPPDQAQPAVLMSRAATAARTRGLRGFKRPPWLVIVALVIATPLIANAVMVASVVNRSAPETSSMPPRTAPAPPAPVQVSALSPPPLTPAQRARIAIREAQERGAETAPPVQDAEVPGGQAAGQQSAQASSPSPDPVQDERARLVSDVLPDYTRQLELDKRVVLHVTSIEYNGSGPGCLATVQFDDGSKTVFTTEENDAWRVDLENQDDFLDDAARDPSNAVDTTGPSTP